VPDNETDGEFHDLSDILESVYRSSAILGLAEGRVTIGWYGSRNIVRKDKTWFAYFAYYHSRKRHIRVNRVLDQAWVPAFYIRHVVAHEVLHHLIPWQGRDFHTPQFLRAERALPGYKRATAWYNANVNKLLGQMGPNPT
jgi:hypothetical protein